MNVSCPECRSVFRVDPTKIPELGLRARCSVCGGVITIGAGSSIDEEFAPASQPAAVPVSAAAPTEPARAPAMATSAPPPRSSSAPAAPARPVSPTATPPGRPAIFPPRPPSGTPAASSLPPSAVGGVRPPGFGPRPMMPGVPPARPTPAMPSAPARPSGPSRPFAGPTAAPVATPPASRAPSATPTRTPINPFLANDPNAKARRLSRALVSDLVTYFPQRRDEGLREGTLKDLFRDEIKKSYEEYVDQVGKEFADSTTHFQDALNEILAGGQRLF